MPNNQPYFINHFAHNNFHEIYIIPEFHDLFIIVISLSALLPIFVTFALVLICVPPSFHLQSFQLC